MLRPSIPTLVAWMVFAFGCGGEKPEKAPKPRIEAFEVSDTSVAWGEAVTVFWRTTRAQAVELTANGAPVDIAGASADEGSVDLEVRETTELRFAATGKGGRAEATPVTVTVKEPRIVQFAATPETIEEGEEVTLSWRTEYATSIEIRDAAGHPVDLDHSAVAEGSVRIVPTASTTYTLRAIAGPLAAQAQASVRIREAPGLVVAASPSVIHYGESAHLTWIMTEGEALRIERDGELLHETSEPHGAIMDTPVRTATYVFTAVRAAKSTVESTTVVVQPVVLRFATTATPVPIGGEVEIEWEIGGAAEVELSNGLTTSVYEVAPHDERTLTFPQGPAGTFTLIARNGPMGEKVSATTPVLHPPAIGSFTATPSVVGASPPSTGEVLLAWSGVERAERLVLTGSTTGPIDLTGQPLDEGSILVEILEDTEFELTAENPAGEASARASVRVVPYPKIDRFTASPQHVGAGETFELSWETTDATSIRISTGGQFLDVDPDAVDGTMQLQIHADTRFMLEAFNEAGNLTAREITVTVGPPVVRSFTAMPNYVPVGGNVTFSWTNLGGVYLILEDAYGRILFSSLRADEIESRTFTTSLSEEYDDVFTLTLANGVGNSVTKSVHVVASAGPRILAFAGSHERLTAGESITFSWEVQDDPLGSEPQLSLTDGFTVYDLSDVDPNQGSKTFTIENVGDLTFTFTAQTSLGAKQAHHRATVHGAPQVSLTANPTLYDGTPVTLSWISQHADASLAIYLLDAQGQPIEPPLYEVPEAERAAGSFPIHPTNNGTYRIVATNAAGRTASAEASVTFAPPRILSFEAVPAEVVAGDPVTLTWTTHLATAVDLDLINLAEIVETASPYVDIRPLGATPLAMQKACGMSPTSSTTAEDDGCATLDFPEGFTFPFAGVEHASIVVQANGFLGFGTETPTPYNNQNLPSSLSAANILPFWDDLVGTPNSFHYLHGVDAEGQYLIIQWAEMVLYPNHGVISFQAVLRDDGSVEFRYGAMDPPPTGNSSCYPTTDCVGDANGASATIGIRAPGTNVRPYVQYSYAEDSLIAGQVIEFVPIAP